MGEELPVARKEEEGRPVLLASTSYGVPITTSSIRNQRPQEPNASKSSDGREIKSTKAESKGSGKTKRAYARPIKSERRGRDNKDRKSNRGDEGEHQPAWRNAQELGVTHPGSYCDEAESNPHYWKEVDREHGGSLFQCAKCLKHLWLPAAMSNVIVLGNLMKAHGNTEGYCRFLNKHRPAKIIMAKMQYLRNMEAGISNKRELAKLIVKVMNEDDFDTKEVK